MEDNLEALRNLLNQKKKVEDIYQEEKEGLDKDYSPEDNEKLKEILDFLDNALPNIVKGILEEKEE